MLEEVWDTNASFASVTGEQTELQYYEPDYGRYASMTEAESYTKVIYDEKAFVKTEDNIWQSIALMGIHTKRVRRKYRALGYTAGRAISPAFK